MRNKVTCNPHSRRKREGNPSELSENMQFQGHSRSSWRADSDRGKLPSFRPLTGWEGRSQPLPGRPGAGMGTWPRKLAQEQVESTKGKGHRRKKEKPVSVRVPPMSVRTCPTTAVPLRQRPATGEGTQHRSPPGWNVKEPIPIIIPLQFLPLGL